jgi:hypothetical protein
MLIDKDGFKQDSPALHNFPLKTDAQRKAFKDIRQRIKDSMDRQGFIPELQLGRYVTYVFSPGIGNNGGEFTAIELKTESKSLTDLQNLIVKLKNQMSDTRTNNLKKDDDNVTKNPGYNWEFNDKEIRDTMFISGLPGQQFDLTITEFGKLRFKYRNSNFDTDWSKTGIVDYTLSDLNTITDGENGTINVLGLFKSIQQDINKKIEEEKIL